MKNKTLPLLIAALILTACEAPQQQSDIAAKPLSFNDPSPTATPIQPTDCSASPLVGIWLSNVGGDYMEFRADCTGTAHLCALDFHWSPQAAVASFSQELALDNYGLTIQACMPANGIVPQTGYRTMTGQFTNLPDVNTVTLGGIRFNGNRSYTRQ